MKKTLFILFTLAISCKVFSQNYEFSPLSRYGLGNLQKFKSPFSLHCGGAGVAYTHGDEYNFSNPASLAFLKITDAEIGFFSKYSKLDDYTGSTAEDWSGDLNYINLGVPLFNSINQNLDRREAKYPMGISLNLAPYSQTGYRYVIRDSSILTGTSVREQEGSGGLSQFSCGYGIRKNNFAVGISAAYIFGSVFYTQSYKFPQIISSASSYLEDNYHASGFDINLGFIYSMTLNKRELKADKSVKSKHLNFGLNLHLPGQLNIKRDVYEYTRLNIADITDTVKFEKGVSSNAQLPLKLEMGLYYNNKGKTGYLLDLAFEAWESSKLHESSKGNLSNLFRLNAGGTWRPNASGYAKLFNRSQYRYGVFYETGYLKIGDEPMIQYGLSFGMGMPFSFQRQLAVINLGFEAGVSQINESIKSQYVRLNIGVRLNDNEWFLKRKYN